MGPSETEKMGNMFRHILTHCLKLETENSKMTRQECNHSNRKYLYLRQYDRYHYNSDGKRWVFDHAQLAETDPGQLRQ